MVSAIDIGTRNFPCASILFLAKQKLAILTSGDSALVYFPYNTFLGGRLLQRQGQNEKKGNLVLSKHSKYSVSHNI